MFNNEIIDPEIIFGTSHYKIRKVWYSIRSYTWGEVWEQPATCRALVGLFCWLKKVVLQVASGASHLYFV